jgi:hypothetical protein
VYAQSIFKEVFFLSFGQKVFFSAELLRPLISVNNDFENFFIFEVLKKLIKIFTSLRVCSSLYAEAEGTGAQAEHTRKALVRMLSIRVRN